MAHFIDDDKDLHIECHTTCTLFALPSTDIDFYLVFPDDVERGQAGFWVPYLDLKMLLLVATAVVPSSEAALQVRFKMMTKDSGGRNVRV